MDNQSNESAAVNVETNGQHINPEPIQPNAVPVVETDDDEGTDGADGWEKESTLLLKSACKRLRKLERSKLRGYLLAGRDLQASLNLSIVNGTSRKVASQVMYGSISKATGRDASESFVSLLLSTWAIVANLSGDEYLTALENDKQGNASWDGLKRISACLKREDSAAGDIWDVSEKVAAVENGASKLESLVREYLQGKMSAAKIEESYKALIKPQAAQTTASTVPAQTGAGRNPNPETASATTAAGGITLAPPAGGESTVPSVQDAQGTARVGAPPKPLISTDPVRSNPNTDGEALVKAISAAIDPASVAERIGGLLARDKANHVLAWKLLQGFIDSAEDDALGKLNVMLAAEVKERQTVKNRKAIEDARRKASADANAAYQEEEGETVPAQKIVA